MKKLTIDFTRHYSTGDAREADSNAYQWDTGHVLEAIVPGAVKTAEVHYSGPASEKADPFLPDPITTDSDGNSVITSKIPNQFFEHSGRLTAYIVVTDDSASITTYEGRIIVLNRSKPDDYLSDPTDNAAAAMLAPLQTLVNQAKASASSASASAATAKAASDSVVKTETGASACSYNSGDFFIFGGVLYRATQDFSGVKLTGSNITSYASPVSQAALNAVNADIKEINYALSRCYFKRIDMITDSTKKNGNIIFSRKSSDSGLFHIICFGSNGHYVFSGRITFSTVNNLGFISKSNNVTETWTDDKMFKINVGEFLRGFAIATIDFNMTYEK